MRHDEIPTRRVHRMRAGTLDQILERKPVSLIDRFVANDRQPIAEEPGIGGWIGVFIMIAMTVFIGGLVAAAGF
jgi:hypothetical protein